MHETLRESLRSSRVEIRNVRICHERARRATIILKQRDKMVAAGMPEIKIKRAVANMIRQQHMEGVHLGASTGAESEYNRYLLRKRRMELKRIARHKNLAYGFLKGIPYKAMEQKSYEPPSWHVSVRRASKINEGHNALGFDAVFEIIKANTVEDPRIYVQRYAEWLGAAGKWEHPNAN